MAFELSLWWTFLGVVSVINGLAWGASAVMLHRRRTSLDAQTLRLRRLQLALSAVYVAGCAIRSTWPVFDVPRLCLVDAWPARVIVGRSVATLAELCFAAQWALLLAELSSAARSRFGLTVSAAILPVIAAAQCSAWYAVLTTSNIGHVSEASLWCLAAAAAVSAFIVVRPHFGAPLRVLIGVWITGGLGYLAFMLGFDLPMYAARWVDDAASGRGTLGLAEGLLDVARACTVSHRWEDWHSEVVWMSLYFSAAVWASLSLVHLPAVAPARQTGARSPRRVLPVAPR